MKHRVMITPPGIPFVWAPPSFTRVKTNVIERSCQGSHALSGLNQHRLPVNLGRLPCKRVVYRGFLNPRGCRVETSGILWEDLLYGVIGQVP